MCCNNKCSSYFTNLGSAARQNRKERTTVVEGDFMRVNVMCISMGDEIGLEVHETEDQLITVVSGTATVKLGKNRCKTDCTRRLTAGESVFIPAGIWHNICNTGTCQLKLISAYAREKELFTQTQDGACGCQINSGC